MAVPICMRTSSTRRSWTLGSQITLTSRGQMEPYTTETTKQPSVVQQSRSIALRMVTTLSLGPWTSSKKVKHVASTRRSWVKGSVKVKVLWT